MCVQETVELRTVHLQMIVVYYCCQLYCCSAVQALLTVEVQVELKGYSLKHVE